MASQNTTTPTPAPPSKAMQLCCTLPVVKALHAVCKANVPDVLASGPKSIAQLAQATNMKEDNLFRLLRALESYGIFSRTTTGDWENNFESELLIKEAPQSLRTLINHVVDESYNGYTNMYQACTQADVPQISWKLYSGGDDFWSWLNKPENAENLKNFNEYMVNNSARQMGSILHDYDWSKFKNSVVSDIGGGKGHLLMELIKMHPEIQPVVFDSVQMIDEAKEYWKDSSVNVSLCAGDFFKNVPVADAYVLKHILHDWSNEESITILKTIHDQAKHNGAKLLIIEMAFEEGKVLEPWQAFLDLQMMAFFDSKERSKKEWEELLKEGGFKIDEIVKTSGDMSIIEASPII